MVFRSLLVFYSKYKKSFKIRQKKECVFFFYLSGILQFQPTDLCALTLALAGVMTCAVAYEVACAVAYEMTIAVAFEAKRAVVCGVAC